MKASLVLRVLRVEVEVLNRTVMPMNVLSVATVIMGADPEISDFNLKQYFPSKINLYLLKVNCLALSFTSTMFLNLYSLCGWRWKQVLGANGGSP